MLYEDLLIEADMSNLIVKEKPLINNDGLISGNRIAIRKNIATTTEKACVLAEELGHHYTTTGNILDCMLGHGHIMNVSVLSVSSKPLNLAVNLFMKWLII